MDNKTMYNNIKLYFEQRTIHPSAQSWDRLDAMLSIAETPKKKKRPLFLLIAASLAPIFMVCLWFIFKKDMPKIKTDESVVVTEKYKTPWSVNLKNEFIPTNGSAEKEKSKSVAKNHKSQVFIVGQSPTKNVNDQHQSEKNVLVPLIAGGNLLSENTAQKQNIQINDEQASVIYSQPITVFPETSEHPVIYIENEIVAKISQKKDEGVKYKYGLDPEKLLKEAEVASHQSFLSKVFKTLTEKSETMVTAVSQRNEVKPK